MSPNTRHMRAFLLLFIFFSSSAYAQLQTLDVNGPGGSDFGTVKFNNPSTLGQRVANKIDYSEVRGSYFWDDQWSPAILISKKGAAFKVQEAKLNRYTNEIHYMDKSGAEMVAQNGISKIIVFDKADTTRIKAVFQSATSLGIPNSESYIQVLNDGNIQLLKKGIVTLKKGDYDPSLGKSDLSFMSKTEYFIKSNETITPLKKINKASLFAIIEPSEQTEKWLETSNNKLKSDEDLVVFLNFCNSLTK